MTNSKTILVLAFICIALFGCSLTSSKSNKQVSYSVDGIWSGYSDQQELVMFLIKDNALSKFYFGTTRDCVSGKEDFYLFNITGDVFMLPVWVQDNGLSLTVRETYETAPNKFKVTFQSDTIASGTFDISWNIDGNCKGKKTITWQAIKRIVPLTDQCIKVSDSKDDLTKIANGSCVEKTVSFNGKTGSYLFVKRAKDTAISLYSTGSIFFVFSPESIVIRYTPMSSMFSSDIFTGQWMPWFQVSPDDLITGTGFTQKGEQLITSKSKLPVLKWNGYFYIALVDFYEPLEMYDFSKE